MSKRFTLSLRVSPPPTVVPLSLSLPFTCGSLMSSLHPLFMRFFISVAFLRQNVMANCHLRSEMSLSLSPSHPSPIAFFFVFSMSSQVLLVQSPHAESSKRSRAQLTGKNGKHLHTELRRKNKRTIPWSLLFFCAWNEDYQFQKENMMCFVYESGSSVGLNGVFAV